MWYIYQCYNFSVEIPAGWAEAFVFVPIIRIQFMLEVLLRLHFGCLCHFGCRRLRLSLPCMQRRFSFLPEVGLVGCFLCSNSVVSYWVIFCNYFATLSHFCPYTRPANKIAVASATPLLQPLPIPVALGRRGIVSKGVSYITVHQGHSWPNEGLYQVHVVMSACKDVLIMHNALLQHSCSRNLLCHLCWYNHVGQYHASITQHRF